MEPQAQDYLGCSISGGLSQAHKASQLQEKMLDWIQPVEVFRSFLPLIQVPPSGSSLISCRTLTDGAEVLDAPSSHFRHGASLASISASQTDPEEESGSHLGS